LFEQRVTEMFSPYVRAYARASRSAPALAAEYGELGSRMWSSFQEPSGIVPYTSSVETCTTRPTWCRSAASKTCCAPTKLVVAKSAAPVIDRSTWVSAAKLTTASCPASAASRAAGSQMSPRTKR
jgi:hypothetical protein